MKRVVSISLGASERDYQFTTNVLGQRIEVQRIGTNGDVGRATALVRKHDGAVDVIGRVNAVPSHGAGVETAALHLRRTAGVPLAPREQERQHAADDDRERHSVAEIAPGHRRFTGATLVPRPIEVIHPPIAKTNALSRACQRNVFAA